MSDYGFPPVDSSYTGISGTAKTDTNVTATPLKDKVNAEFPPIMPDLPYDYSQPIKITDAKTSDEVALEEAEAGKTVNFLLGTAAFGVAFFFTAAALTNTNPKMNTSPLWLTAAGALPVGISFYSMSFDGSEKAAGIKAKIDACTPKSEVSEYTPLP